MNIKERRNVGVTMLLYVLLEEILHLSSQTCGFYPKGRQSSNAFLSIQ